MDTTLTIAPEPQIEMPEKPVFVKARLRWGGQEWDVEVCGLDRPEKGGRCVKQIAASLTIPWRWEPQLIIIEANDVAEFQIGDKIGSQEWETAEITYSEVASFPERKELIPGVWSTEFTAFRWVYRKAA